jgi:HPt (histidine-containing phosphotransfer) domain-containing protein
MMESEMAQPTGRHKIVSTLIQEDPDLRDIVEEFIGGLPEQIDQLCKAYADLDWSTMQTLAHRLKGAGGSYGYAQLSQTAAAMEAEFKQNCAEHFESQINELRSLIDAAKAGLSD